MRNATRSIARQAILRGRWAWRLGWTVIGRHTIRIECRTLIKEINPREEHIVIANG
jgi:hypothetical protein